MALRRRDAAIAWLVAFISWTLVTNWFPTGRLLSYAFLAGAIAGLLALLWLVVSTSRGSRYLSGRDENNGVRKVRTASFVEPSRWKHKTERLRQSLDYKQTKIYEGARKSNRGGNHLLSQRIDLLLSNVQNDYINSWHSRISGRSAFTNEVDFTIRTALINILDRMSAVDVADVAVSHFLPIITAHVRDFADAERATWGERLIGETSNSDELVHVIAKRYRNGKVHHAASLSHSNAQSIQHQHLRNIVLGILPSILPPSMMTSSLVCVFMQEIIAGAILLPLMQSLTEPDFWNQLIISQGRVYLQERHKVVKLRAALQEHATSSPKAKKPTHYPRLLAKDSERKFDSFVRRIRSCRNPTEAHEILSGIINQIQKEMQADRPDQLYLHRLESGKKLLEQKIERLNANKPDQSSSRPQGIPMLQSRLAQKDNITLKATLYDASGLSAFMRYMDRLNLISLVKFYLVVDGVGAPSEQDINGATSPLNLPIWTESDRANMVQIYNSYLTKPELNFSINVLNDVKRFLRAGVNASRTDYFTARRSILEAQAMIFNRMQDPHFLDFKNTDIFYNWLVSEDTSTLSELPKRNSDHKNDEGSSVSNTYQSQDVSLNLRAEPSQLRRSTASTSDLKEEFKSAETPRRSLDERVRKPLFDDDYDSDNLASSVQSLNSVDGDVQTSKNQKKIMETMQAELNNIVDGQSDAEALLYDVNGANVQSTDANTLDQDETKTSLLHPSKERQRPSIASLGLVGEPTRGTVFSDDLFADEEKFVEDEREDSDVDDKSVQDEVHEADPGDLGLAEAVSASSTDIERLAAQELIVDSLTNKANLTNNVPELRILRKSKTSLQREIRRKELQRQQYIVQESDNSLYGRATASIQSVMVANSKDGEEYALYIIEVKRHSGDQTKAASWVVPKRYSEFHSLNKQLKAKYPIVRNLDFPRRQVVLKLQKDFLRKRRLALEKYLQSLLLIPEICRSRELRAFLSQRAIISSTSADNNSMSSSYSSSATSTINTRDFVSRIYNSVTDGMEEFLGNIPVLEQLSMAGQNIISAATTQMNAGMPPSMAAAAMPDFSENTTAAAVAATAVTAEMQAELQAAESQRPGPNPKLPGIGPGNEAKSFIKPICDAFLELFDLDKGNNWLRGRAVVLVLHQLLGGTVERKVRESVRALLAEEQVLQYLELVDGMLRTDNGKPQDGGGTNKPRSPAEKTWSKQEAGLILSALVPEVVGNVVGRANAQAASQKFLAVLNNGRLNTHLAYTLLDKIVNVLFSKSVNGQAQKK